MKFRLRKLITIKRFWILFAVLAVLAALGTVSFYGLSRWVNSVRLPEELKKPPSSLISCLGQTPQLSTINHDELLKLKNYDDYFRFRRSHDPDLKSIPYYLELLKRFREEKIDESISGIPDNNYRKADAKWAAWIREHTDYIDLLQHFARAGPFPQLTLAEQLEYEKINPINTFWRDNLDLYDSSICILNALAYQRVEENKYEQARLAIEESLRLVENFHNLGGNIGQSILERGSKTAIKMIDRTVEDPEYPVSELREMIPVLERSEKLLLRPGRLADSLLETYLLLERPYYINEMESNPWHSMIYGWYPDSINNYYDIKIFSDKKIKFPSIAGITSALTAMHNRLHSAEGLEKLDRYHKVEFEYAKLTYIERLRVQARWTKENDYDCFLTRSGSYEMLKERERSFEYMDIIRAQFHLARLGAMCRADTTATLALRGKDLRADPANPWRDPFTEKPMQIDNASTQTIIFSSGTDPQDKGNVHVPRIEIRIPR